MMIVYHSAILVEPNGDQHVTIFEHGKWARPVALMSMHNFKAIVEQAYPGKANLVMSNGQIREGVRQWRKDKGLTQTEAAELLGMSRVWFSYVETGKKSGVSLDVYRKIIEVVFDG